MVQRKEPEEVAALLRVYGARLRTARIRRRWSQADLAARMNVERRTVARLEKGDPGVSMSVLLSALRVLGLWHTVEHVADPMHASA